MWFEDQSAKGLEHYEEDDFIVENAELYSIKPSSFPYLKNL